MPQEFDDFDCEPQSDELFCELEEIPSDTSEVDWVEYAAYFDQIDREIAENECPW